MDSVNLKDKLKKILIVEDDRDLNDAYSLILQNDGYTIKKAFNGKQALDIHQDFDPDLILLDLLMPVMDGLQFLKELKKLTNKLPKIVLFTNMDNSSELLQAQQIGECRCITKSSIEPGAITKIVKENLDIA